MKPHQNLAREVGVSGAVMMGMGSIVGTGVFVSLGLAAGLTGVSMIFALFLAGLLAVCNGLSSAQLAAAHPVSGGTYEYGYKYLNPWLGYLAGWLFVAAKSASAATAAIGFGGYFLRTLEIQALEAWQIGFVAAILVVGVCAFGIKRSSLANITIVLITLLSLFIYIVTLAPEASAKNFTPLFENFTGKASPLSAFFEATALMFVAYTGYGRIATLGEEIKNPVKNIPKAIIVTLGLSFFFYMAVAIVSVGAAGADKFYSATIEEAAPLEVVATISGHPWIANILALGAMTAMLGVLLNLVLGLSRVIFAMGRKGDLPRFFSKVDAVHHAPIVGVIASGVIILSLTLLKDVKATWSFSAFTVLFYYAITNFAALKLPKERRLYSRVFPWLGLFGCLGLSAWVDKTAMLLGGTILLIGVLWRFAWKKLNP